MLPNWYINCVAAQILKDKHGFTCSKAVCSGRYYISFETDTPRLYQHPSYVRQPRYQVGLDHVWALMLIPTNEARNEYISSVQVDTLKESPSDS